MKTYYVTNKIDGRVKVVKAANIDNLRKNLMKGLRAKQKRFVYADREGNEFIGLLARLPEKRDSGWPNFLWFSDNNSYKVNKDGSIGGF